MLTRKTNLVPNTENQDVETHPEGFKKKVVFKPQIFASRMSSMNPFSGHAFPPIHHGIGAGMTYGCPPGSGSPMCGVIEKAAAEGKMQLNCLNQRLVKLLQSRTHHVDMSSVQEVHDLIKDMRDETSRISERYEREIKHLNESINKSRGGGGKDGAQIIVINNRLKVLTDDVQSWKIKYRDIEMELQRITGRRTEVEKEVVELKARIRSLEIELETTKKAKNSGAGEANRIIVMLNQEKEELVKKSKHVQSLEEERRMLERRFGEERKQWDRKIDIFQKTIMNLENQIRDFMRQAGSGSGCDIAAVLSQMRAMFHKEMEVKQQQTSAALHQTLHNISGNMPNHGVDIATDGRYQSMQADARQTKQRVVELQSQASSYQSQVSSLQSEIARERQSFSQKIRELEQQMTQFYQSYIKKTEECTLAREVQTALQAEISAFGAIIQALETEK